mgnify:CR=1 FL=1
MKTSDSIKSISAALVAAHANLDGVPKDATNTHFENHYASLAAVIDASKPALLAQGLVVLQGLGAIANGALHVTTRLLHGPSGEWIESTMEVPLTKQNAQGAGSAASYGRRYGLAAILSLAQVDDDGEDAVQPAKKAPAKVSTSLPAGERDREVGKAPRPDHHALAKFMADNAIPRASFERACADGLKKPGAKVTDLSPAQVEAVTRILTQELDQDTDAEDVPV